MNPTASENVLKFLGFDYKTVEEVSYLIDIGKILEYETELRKPLLEFDPKPNEPTPIFYKRMFLSELSWCLTQLVCAEYYPEQAVKNIEDFGLFFQDKWLDNEDKNPFYDFWLKTDLRTKTKREIVELNYEYLKDVYKEFFNVEEYVDEHIKSVKHWLDAFEFGELS